MKDYWYPKKHIRSQLRAFEQMKRQLHRPLITTEGIGDLNGNFRWFIAAHKIRQIFKPITGNIKTVEVKL